MRYENLQWRTEKKEKEGMMFIVQLCIICIMSMQICFEVIYNFGVGGGDEKAFILKE